MADRRKYNSIAKIKQQIFESPTFVSFLEKHKDQLFTLLSIPSNGEKNPTKKSLLALLDAEQSKLALEYQSQKLEKGLASGKLLPTKASLERKKKEEMSKMNYLPMILQLACSHPEYYFRSYKDTVSKEKLIDSVVIDPNMIPQGFLDAFQISTVDMGAENIKQLFKKAKPLRYHKDKPATTWRVNFIDGKIIVFRELQQLLHKEGYLTQGEKRRIDYKKYFNTFDDIYAAIRSHQYIVDKEDDKIEDYKGFQKDIITLIQDIKNETKQGSEHRKLDDIIADIAGATSFNVMASKFYNLFKIDFVNKSIAANHLQGASNKFSKESYRLRNIILETQLQSDALQQLLDQQKYPLAMFHAQLGMTMSKKFKDSNYIGNFRTYYKQLASLPQKTEPFITFENEIIDVFGSLDTLKPMAPSEKKLKSDVLIAFQEMRLKLYELEHKIKLGTVTPKDFVFDTSIFKTYPELYEDFFISFDMFFHTIESYSHHMEPGESMEHCLSLLQQLKDLPDRKENIQALAKL